VKVATAGEEVKAANEDLFKDIAKAKAGPVRVDSALHTAS